MQLIPWSHPTRHAALTLRGWRTPASGKPVLHFLHGNGFCCRAYEPMLALLAADFDLWLCDIQGHGDSDPGTRFLGWNENAAMAAEAFAAHRHVFDGAPAYAAGHSFGGVLTSLMLDTQPALFERAVLLDPVWFPPAMLTQIAFVNGIGLGPQTPFARSASRRRSQWDSRAAAYADLRERGTFRHWRDDALMAYVEHGLRDGDGRGAANGVTLKCAPSLEARIFHTYPDGLWRAIRAIRTPVRVLFGEQSMTFVKPAVERAAGLNSHLSAQQVAGGHCFMQEDPDRAAEYVRAGLLLGHAPPARLTA